MRLSFLLLALVAAATALPQLQIKAGNVDAVKKQRDVLLLLQQLFQEIPDVGLRKICKEYDIKKSFHNYNDQGVVKYLIRAFKMGYFQCKGLPFTPSISKLRLDVAVLTRVFLGAKDYVTFVKTAAWARCHLNEAQFLKAFVAAILQRHDTRDIVLPAMYEVFPYYYFDARVIRRAQDLRAKCMGKTDTKKVIEIPSEYQTAWLPKDELSLAHFTQDIGLANFYSYFSLAAWMLPSAARTTDDTVAQTSDCTRCEINRGSQYQYIHQQLVARYDLERLSNNLKPVEKVDFTNVRTPFKPHLSYANGLEFPGRFNDPIFIQDYQDLVKTVFRLERRLKDAIDSGYVMTTQGSLLALYDRKGLDMLGNLIEGTGRSINPRYYGSLQLVARTLLGGAPDPPFFFEPTPGALEISHTATRDPVFYKLYRRINSLFKRYQDALPMYKEDNLMLPGVTIEDIKFDKLVTYCEKFEVDIDAATIIPCDTDKENVQIKAVVDRLNHKPFNYEILVQSDKFVKDAVVRVFIGPKYHNDGCRVDIRKERLRFVELDQFLWDIKEGKTIIERNSNEAPMRSNDPITKKNLLRGVEDALNSHQPFYPTKIAQMTGFPERLALPKGRRDGLPLQVVAIISSPKAKTITYGPVVPKQFQTYQRLDFEDIVSDSTEEFVGRRYLDSDESVEDTYGRDSEKLLALDEIPDRQFNRYIERTIDDERYGRERRTGVDYNRDTTKFVKSGTDAYNVRRNENVGTSIDYMNDYYKDKHISEIVGGAISLDGRPLGYPFDRPMTEGCRRISNLKVTDVKVFFEGRDCKC